MPSKYGVNSLGAQIKYKQVWEQNYTPKNMYNFKICHVKNGQASIVFNCKICDISVKPASRSC